MIWSLITSALPDVWPLLLAAGGIVVAFFAGRRGGAAKVKQKQAEAALDATQKGHAGASKGKAEAAKKLRGGMTPEEITRSNDAKWD
ncbi:MAG: hypothetical protein ACRC14_02630 [Paracoccaceae bacterium]